MIISTAVRLLGYLGLLGRMRIMLLVFICLSSINEIASCSPGSAGGGKSKQYCVTSSHPNLPPKLASELIDPDSNSFKLFKQLVMTDVGRLVEKNNWKRHLKPDPTFCTFKAGDSDNEVKALLNVFADVDANELQKQLKPDGLLDPPPAYPPASITASEGVCKTSGNETCHP